MIIKRLKEYIDKKGISISAFEKSVGMSNASFAKAYKSNGAMGTDRLEKILSIYQDINPEWLLSGKGEMFTGIDSSKKRMQRSEAGAYFGEKKQGEMEEVAYAAEPVLSLKQSCDSKDLLIKEKELRIEEMKSLEKVLREYVALLQRQVTMLEEKIAKQ